MAARSRGERGPSVTAEVQVEVRVAATKVVLSVKSSEVLQAEEVAEDLQAAEGVVAVHLMEEEGEVEAASTTTPSLVWTGTPASQTANAKSQP